MRLVRVLKADRATRLTAARLIRANSSPEQTISSHNGQTDLYKPLNAFLSWSIIQDAAKDPKISPGSYISHCIRSPKSHLDGVVAELQ